MTKGETMASTSSDEEEFVNRDSMGLVPESKRKKVLYGKNEAEARTSYFRMLAAMMFVSSPLLATLVHSGVCHLSPSHAATLEHKLDFIRQNDLGYVFLAWFVVNAARSYASVNAMGARAPAGVDRPDQHVYKIMAASGPLANAPYVLMATTGSAGRFNRAQRVCSNMDESMPLFLTGLLLQGAVYGPIAAAIAILYMFASARFANDYKNAAKARFSGFRLMKMTNGLSSGFILMTAIKTLF